MPKYKYTIVECAHLTEDQRTKINESLNSIIKSSEELSDKIKKCIISHFDGEEYYYDIKINPKGEGNFIIAMNAITIALATFINDVLSKNNINGKLKLLEDISKNAATYFNSKENN